MFMLLIDIGNSRIKWAFSSDGVWKQQGVALVGEWSAVQQAFARLGPMHKIVACNVAGDDAAAQLRTACSALSCPVEFVTARETQCGVRNGYAQPNRLGSDRWAALIAAWHQTQAPCLVVNCGTATTVDALSADGEFLGGLILPGIDMMQGSLLQGTAQVKEANGHWQAFPRNTADAVASGALQATVGAIHRQYELLGVPGAACVLDGGAADQIQPLLKLPVKRVDNLVLRGLQIIAEEAAGC
jgi:type III pantothenate kinase